MKMCPPVISLSLRPGGERAETKAKRAESERGSQRDIRFSCAPHNFLLAPCYKACAFYLEKAALASRMEEGEKKKKQSGVTRCIVASIFWDGVMGVGGGGETEQQKFHFNSVCMADHIFPSAPIKASQNFSVLARLCASNTLPQDQYALVAFGIDCWKKFSGKSLDPILLTICRAAAGLHVWLLCTPAI